ncbi:MAG: DNA gyrase subunit B [Candidatus Micrarchaeaceae archaeon]
MQNDKDEYTASKIVVLEGAEGIRKRPAMYIGSTSVEGVLHLLSEVVDNAVDEAMAGYCKNITVHLTQDETSDIAEVSDDGRGIPVDIMPKFNKSALEIIMTTLHSGAKFDNNVYKISGGLHGVGLTVVNALSEYTEVTVMRDGKIYTQRFERGKPVTQLQISGESSSTGTKIKFKPDPEIFHVPRFDSEQIKLRLEYTSYLNPNIRITFIDDRFGTHEEKQYLSVRGIPELVEELNKGKKAISDIIYSRKTADRVIVEFSMQYNDSYEEKLLSFVNNIITFEGGTHVTGFHSALTRAVVSYISKSRNHNGKNKKEKEEIKIDGSDVREGLTAVLSVLIPNPEFEGQTKEKLGNIEVKSAVENIVYNELSTYFEEHPSSARAIAEKVLNAAVARESARKARELARKKNIFEGAILPGKLADCIYSDPDKTELFIVEGESAGGSSKQARDRNTQAILPLRGKILNVEKASDEKIFNSEYLHLIVTALGAGMGDNFNIDALRYKKIIIMSDADVDGSHIKTLLLTFFYRYMKKIIEAGYVYLAQPPLYKLKKGKSIFYCYNDSELNEKMKELGDGVELQRYKGLGEMNPEQLWETTMDPERRILKQVTIKDAEMADRLFTILMGVDVSERRKFLEEHSGEVKVLDI